MPKNKKCINNDYDIGYNMLVINGDVGHKDRDKHVGPFHII